MCVCDRFNRVTEFNIDMRAKRCEKSGVVWFDLTVVGNLFSPRSNLSVGYFLLHTSIPERIFCTQGSVRYLAHLCDNRYV